MEKPTAKVITSKTAAQLLDAKPDTLNRKAAKSPCMFRKCSDGHYRGTLKNWEKLLGLTN